MSVKDKLIETKDRAVNYCRENKEKVAIAVTGVCAAIGLALCYGSGYRDGERRARVQGFETCNTFLGGLVKEYDPETHQKVQDIIDEHSVEYFEKITKE